MLLVINVFSQGINPMLYDQLWIQYINLYKLGGIQNNFS